LVAFLLIGGIGFFMLVLTWILGELFDLGHGLAGFFGEHVGDVSVEGHHLELGHHVEGGGMPTPSPLSSRVIFAFMTAFGGGGAVASVYGLSTLPSVGIGLGSGLVIGGLVYALTLAVFRQQATSGFEVASLVGKPGRVVIAIPAGGTGQVSVAAGGGSSTLLASARDGDAVPEGSTVRVVQVQGDRLVIERETGAPERR